MNKRLIVSTGNKNKIREIKNILNDLNIEVLSKSDIGYSDLEVEEDGDTLEENSYKKAKALSLLVDDMVIADDSGLFIEALDGNPGIHSSRYSGEEGNDDKNNQKILSELEGVKDEDRLGEFRTVITLITEEKENIFIEGICKGKINNEIRGKNGFGYDPIFIPEGYDRTFGELDEDIKNKLSHRYDALQKLRMILIELIE